MHIGFLFNHHGAHQVAHALPVALRGQSLFESELDLDELSAREAAGWGFRSTKISKKFSFDTLKSALPDDADLLLLVQPSGVVKFFTHASRPTPDVGDVVLSYAPPDVAKAVARRERKTTRKTAAAAE